MASTISRPWRPLIALGIALALLFGIMAFSNLWKPKLGLDLRGGTQIVLETQDSPTVKADRESTDRALEVLRRRVRAEAVAAEEGLVYRLSQTLHLNTVDSHRLIHLAHEQGGNELQGRVKEALLAAYFTEARNVADHDVLRDVAQAEGLDATRVEEVLGSREFEGDVHADVAQAQAYGASGVPFFVIDQKYGVSGAQPTEVFTQVLERAWAESQPKIEVLATGADGQECGPDGCAI